MSLMSFWLFLPLLLTAVFGVTAPVLARALPPAVATWLLSAGGLLSAAASSASLALLAFVLIAQTPQLAARGQWSDEVLRHHNPVATPIAILAAAAVLVFAMRLLRAAGRRLAAVRDAYRLAAGLPGGAELSVLDTVALQAFAVPGRPGRIVVTTGLLRSLDAGQRRALLAHERAHLRHRHHVHQTAAHLAAAANPLLGGLPSAVELSCERWADEDAAALCRRDTVADALTRAATGSTHAGAPAVVLAAATSDVVVRIGALRDRAPRLAPWRLALPLGVLVATAVAVAVAMHDTERLFELAQHAYRTGQR